MGLGENGWVRGENGKFVVEVDNFVTEKSGLV